jgi:hypothetical protein
MSTLRTYIIGAAAAGVVTYFAQGVIFDVEDSQNDNTSSDNKASAILNEKPRSKNYKVTSKKNTNNKKIINNGKTKKNRRDIASVNAPSTNKGRSASKTSNNRNNRNNLSNFNSPRGDVLQNNQRSNRNSFNSNTSGGNLNNSVGDDFTDRGDFSGTVADDSNENESQLVAPTASLTGPTETFSDPNVGDQITFNPDLNQNNNSTTVVDNVTGGTETNAVKEINVNSIAMDGNQISVVGVNLTEVTSARVSGNGQSTDFSVATGSSDFSLKLVATKALGFIVGGVYELILSTAVADTVVPLTFTFNDQSVLLKHLGMTGSADGDVISWDNTLNQWVVLAQSGSSDGSGSGTVNSVARGAGLVNSGTPITTTGTIAVDIGFAAGQIPTMDADGNFAVIDKLIRLNNASDSSSFSLSNDTSLRFGHEASGGGITNIVTIESSGDTTFLGKVVTPEVCLAGDCKTAWPSGGGSGLSSLGGQVGGTQSFVVGSGGTAPGIVSATDTHTLNIPMAATAGVTAGLVSKAQFDSFNSKGDMAAVNTASGSGLSGGVSTGEANLQVVVDGSSLEIATNTIQIKSGGVTNVNLASGIDAGKITTGSLPTARLNVGTGANQVVQLDGSSKLPAVDGSLLTNLPASGATGSAGGDLVGTYPNPTLATSGVSAGSYGKVTVDAKGIVTAGSALLASDIPNLDGSKITSGSLSANGVTVNDQFFLKVGKYTNAQEVALTLVPADTGKMWYNSDSNEVKFYDGTGIKVLNTSAAATGIGSLGGESGTAQTFAVNNTGTTPAINSASDIHTLSIPLAAGAGVTAGLLSKTDYDSFAAKGDITSVVTATGSALTGGAANGDSTLAVVVDGTGLEIATNTIQLKDGGVINSKLASGIDASKITAGSLPTARIDVGTGANQLVQLNGTSKLPAIDGSLLINLPVAASVLSGFATGVNSTVTSLDSVEVAVEKLQGQVNGRVPSSLTINGNDLTGNIALTKADVGLSDVANIKDNLAATVAPTVSNDTSEGFSPGSRWIDVVGEKVYICVDESSGAAVWKEVSNLAASGGGGGKELEVKTGNFTISSSDNGKFFLIKNTADSSVTLPSAATVGSNFSVSFKHSSLFPVTFIPDGSEKIDDIPTANLISMENEFEIISDGTNWIVSDGIFNGTVTVNLSGDIFTFNLSNHLITLGEFQSTKGVNLLIIIATGARIGANNAEEIAFDLGSLPPYIKNITLVNHGEILGAGGNGKSETPSLDPIAVTDGGIALNLSYPIIIHNQDGNIFGGGGGGVGPHGGICGGGGQGFSGGLKGIVIPTSSCSDGSYAAPGNQSSGGRSGGFFGEQGEYVDSYGTHIGGAGGAAIEKNGNIVRFANGNDGTHVKGDQNN